MAKFEESIAVVRAVTKATVQDFENLRDKAQQLGITTRFSATQAADAMVLLARAGFSVDETMTAVGQTLLLAQAGGLGMAEAADITASSLRGFGLEAIEVTRVTDVLVETANSANTNVSQLGQALKFVAPIAKGLGQEIEITNAALGILSNAGLKATLAVTGLRRVLAELASPGRELNDILTASGLVAADVDPQVVGLTNALEELKQAGFDTGDALEVFGQRGGPAFAVLVDRIDEIRTLEQGLKDAGGEADRVAKIMDQTLNGALFRLKSALEGVNLAVGEVFASPVLVATLEQLTGLLRLVAANADVLQVALVSLAIVGVAKLAAVITSALIPALIRLAASVPTFLVVAAAIAPLIRATQQYNSDMEALGKTLGDVEDDSKLLSKAFVQQAAAQRELNRLNRLEKGSVVATGKRGQEEQIVKIGQLSEAQAARRKILTAAIEAGTEAQKLLTAAQKESNEREARGAALADAAIARLEQRQRVLSALTDEEKSRAEFEAVIDRLEKQGSVPDFDQKSRLRALSEENEEFAIQQKIFERIKGPQRVFRQETAALNALLNKGAIDAREFAIELQNLRDAIEQPDTGLNALDNLRVENELLVARIKFGEKFAKRLELEHQLRLAKEPVDKKAIQNLIDEIDRNFQLTKVLQDKADAERDADRAAQQQEKQLDRLERRIKSQQALNDEIGLLKELFDQGRLSAEELARALEDVQLRGLEASSELEDGFTRAFINMRREAEDLASVGEKVANIFADNVTDALAGLAEDGKLSFKDLANSIVRDLARVLARLLVVQAVQSILGGGGGGLGAVNALFSPSSGSGTTGGGFSGEVGFRAKGGAVQANRSFVVGEDGPELFRPNQGGDIVPNNQLAGQAAAPNIQIVNVQSEDDVPNAINDGGADEAIINAIARNKDRVSQVIQ